MDLRLADFEKDALAIMDGARDFVARMDYTAFLPETDEGLAEAVAFITSLPGFECWLAEHEGRVVGGIGLLFSPPLWNRRITGMTEMFIWAAEDAPKATLLRIMGQAQRRKEEVGAVYREFVNLTSSPDGMTRIYERMGLRKVQETWIGMG